MIGTVQVGDTGAAGQWLERTGSVTGAAGAHDLYMVFKGGGEPSMFDFDHWRFDR
ncbi:MAG: carbohydrate-binding protein [Sphingomonas sp.]